MLLPCQLAQGERNVSELEATRRDGRQIFYRIGSPAAPAVIETLYKLFCGGRQ